jgi:hypothetical protein
MIQRRISLSAVLGLFIALVPAHAQGTFGTEHAFGVTGLDVIQLTADEKGNVYGSYRKWRDGEDEVQLIVRDAATGRWSAPVSVPESNIVAPIPDWRTNSPDIAYNPVTKMVYIAFGPQSRPINNGMYLQTYDPAEKRFLGLRQIHSNQSEHSTMVVLPNGDLHIIGIEIEPFAVADYRYGAAALRDLHKAGANIRPVRTKIPDMPVSSFPEAEADSNGNIHLATRWRDTFYFKRTFQTGEWRMEKAITDFGDRTKNGESCGNQHDGDPGILVDHHTNRTWIFSTPWDNWKPSCRSDTDSPQDLYVWSAQGGAFTKLSDSPSFFIAEYVPKAAIDDAGNIFVMWPENFGYFYQMYTNATGQWLPEPLPMPTAGRFTQTDPFKTYADGDVVAVGHTFHVVFRDHFGALFANELTALPEALQAPVDLVVDNSAQTGVTLGWTNRHSESRSFARLLVERADAGPTPVFEVIGELTDPAASSFRDQTALAGRAFLYRVTVVDSFDRHASSETSSSVVPLVPLLSELAVLLLLGAWSVLLVRGSRRSSPQAV